MKTRISIFGHFKPKFGPNLGEKVTKQVILWIFTSLPLVKVT